MSPAVAGLVQALARSIPPTRYQIAVAAVVARSPPQVFLRIVERLLDALLERLDLIRCFLIAMGKRPPCVLSSQCRGLN
jgi:hypothetical protein